MRRTFLAVAAGLGLLSGCGPAAPTDPKPTEAKKHAHPTTGPAGGPLAEWGEEEFHVEVVIDHATGEATAYTLDESAKKAVPIDAKSVVISVKETPPVKVLLAAKPQDGDPVGKASRFVGTSDALKTPKEIEGSVSGTAGGKNYSGGFVHRPKK